MADLASLGHGFWVALGTLAVDLDKQLIEEGRALLLNELKCSDCHQFRNKDEEATGPDLTGYGSRKWLINFINNPAHADLYGERNDRMPAFGTDQILSEQAIGLIADWLRGAWHDSLGTAANGAQSPRAGKEERPTSTSRAWNVRARYCAIASPTPPRPPVRR